VCLDVEGIGVWRIFLYYQHTLKGKQHMHFGTVEPCVVSSLLFLSHKHTTQFKVDGLKTVFDSGVPSAELIKDGLFFARVVA
jgi:hypothetical protein